MAVSTIPVFKAALLAQLQARAGLAGVSVTYGYPGPTAETEWVWLADVRGEQHLMVMGSRSRDESYELTVLIKSETSGIDGAAQQATTERVFALMGELEQQLRSDPTVNSTVRVAQVEGPIELVELAGNEKRGSLLTVTVKAEQRI